MITYNTFLGIDIGKFSFFVTAHGRDIVNEYDNDTKGIEQFLTDYEEVLQEALCVLETTGGYEMLLLLTLCQQKIAVHRANTRHVKNFIRSYGQTAKTDALDAKALARYAHERYESLAIYEPLSQIRVELYELIGRQQQLKQMRVSEKNRLQAPCTQGLTKQSCQRMIAVLTAEIDALQAMINERMVCDDSLKEKKAAIRTVPGIGDILSNELVILLPELGQVNRREIASLVGLAPRANDSGQYRGYRSTGYGRAGIKPRLFLAAMAARNSNSPLKAYYNQLVERGKPKKVALTALMRKIIVIANARIKAIESSEVEACLNSSV